MTSIASPVYLESVDRMSGIMEGADRWTNCLSCLLSESVDRMSGIMEINSGNEISIPCVCLTLTIVASNQSIE